jgi:hypothetical protein
MTYLRLSDFFVLSEAFTFFPVCCSRSSSLRESRGEKNLVFSYVEHNLSYRHFSSTLQKSEALLYGERLITRAQLWEEVDWTPYHNKGCTNIQKTMQLHNLYRQKQNQSLYRPGEAVRVPGGWGSQMFRRSEHECGKVVSPKHRPPLPLGNIPGTHLGYRLSWPQGHSATERIISKKNSNDTIANRIRDLPVCSAVLQTTTPTLVPVLH